MRFMVDLHTHTLASDHGYSTIQEYIAAAVDKGILLFATTDYGPGLEGAPSAAHFRNIKSIPHVVNKIAVLRGCSANITAEGGIDLSLEDSKDLDLMLAGFHHNLSDAGIEENTKRMLSVIKSQRVDILSHLGNPQFPINMEEILVAAKEHNVAIEINSSSSVKLRSNSHSNCVTIATMAKKIGNTIAIGSESRIALELGQFDEAIKVLEEAEYPYQDIINISPIKVIEFLQSRGRTSLDNLYNFFCHY